MTEFVENYLRDSAGLVYIIQDAINVHKLKRLFKLEASVTNAFNNYDLEDLSGTQYRRNLFILNKWDIIEEKEAMVHAVKKKLDNHWLTESNFSQLSEVLPLAATVDLQHLRAGYLSDRLRHVIEALKEVVPYNMKLSLQTRYKWLQHLILRVYYHSKRYLSHASALDKGTVSDTQKAAEEKLDKILKTGHKCFLQLLAFIDSIDLTETVEKLNDHLQKKSTRSAMSRWEEDECPGDSDMAMKEIEEQAKQKVEERIRKSIDNWENDNHVFSQCKVPVIQKVKEHLKELELDATSLSESLTSLQPVQVPVSPFSFRFILSKQGSAVGNRFTKLLVSRFQKYRKDYYLANKVQCMEEMTRETLDSLRDEDRLTAVVEEIVSFKEMHGSFVEQVNDLIGQFQEEIEDLKNSGTAKALRSKYEPLSKQCKEIRSRLLAWELRHIFDGNSLQSDEVDIPDEEPISSSSHAVILRGKRKRLGGETVLVKKYRGVAESDLTFINKEYRSLREMSCPDISKVYGMIAVDYCGSRRLCLVMEPGVSNLAKWLEIPDNVAAYNAEIIISHTLKFAYQIARAISVLHDHRVVNRNISSETIIVAEDDSESPGLRCKLYDIGVIQQTAMSLPLNEKLSRYSAPEVVTSTTFKPSMDIFSYGQVLSDLWYGTGETGHNGARKETKGEGGEFEVAPSSVGGLRIPSVRQQSEDVSSQQRTQPPLRYSELIVSCTDSQPKNRPIIEAVKKQLYTITSALEDGDSVDLRKR
jgi:serine/threonine protein kinase